MNCINIYLLLFGADLGAILSPRSSRCVFFEGGKSKTPSLSKMAAGGDPAFDAVSVCSAPVTRTSERGRVVLSAMHSERTCASAYRTRLVTGKPFPSCERKLLTAGVDNITTVCGPTVRFYLRCNVCLCHRLRQAHKSP